MDRTWLPKQCVAGHHTWQLICACGKARICKRCGLGMGEIPCACKQAAS
jgi:hypothetical protein